MNRHKHRGDVATKPSYWTRISDEDLLKRGTRVADPEALEGLLQEKPHTDEIPEIDFDYDTRLSAGGSGNKLRCVHCKKDPEAVNHNRGFVMVYRDGRRILIGINCGEKLYGAEFTHRLGHFEAAQKRSHLLIRRNLVLQRSAMVMAELQAFQGDGCWQVYSDLRRQLTQMMPDLVHEVADAVERRDGALYAVVRVPDPEAEAAYEKRTGRSVPMFKNVEQSVHVLRGGTFLHRTGGPPAVEVDALVRRAGAALGRLSEQALSSHDMALFFPSLKGLLADLDHQAARITDMSEAFTPDNIAGLSGWMEKHRYGLLRLEAGRLYRCNSQGHVRGHENPINGRWVREEMDVPSPLPVAPVERLARVRELLAAVNGEDQKSSPYAVPVR